MVSLVTDSSYAWHTVVMPSRRGMFEYRLVTSIETSMALLGSLILSMKLIKSVVSLRYEACSCAIG